MVTTVINEESCIEQAEKKPVDASVAKPPTTLDEQIEILQNRKLFIDDEYQAKRILEKTNYYRLRGYYIHLQVKDSNDFKHGVSFTEIAALHDFDNELRALLLKLLLDIEINARARIAYAIAHAWGTMGYRDFSNYDPSLKDKFDELMGRIDSDLENSRERFIDNYNKNYGGQFPIWVAVEVMSFGDLSKLYHLLPTPMKKNISAAYDYLDESLFTNWIQCAAMLRNLCAHNSRLYSRNIPTSITIEKKVAAHVAEVCTEKYKLYPQSMFAYLLAMRRISDNRAWNYFYNAFDDLLQKYDCFVDPMRLGLPRQWKEFLFEK